MRVTVTVREWKRHRGRGRERKSQREGEREGGIDRYFLRHKS